MKNEAENRQYFAGGGGARVWVAVRGRGVDEWKLLS